MRTNQTSSADFAELLFSEEDTQIVEADPEHFCINNVEMATWAVRKICANRTTMADRKTLADTYIERIRFWLEKSNREDEDSTDFLMSHLRPFAEREIAKQRRSRTLLLPGASISLRKKPDRLEILDEASVLEYCEEHLPGAIIIRKSISKTVLKASIKNGELPPAVEYIPGEDELHVEADSAVPLARNDHAA